ncbi:carbohydrate ABC transporter permease [Microbacterium aurantiacum]|uniref:carbohydrate ABC transporter permease n=1 Tax=Microbacterium aurantiacum TaxID=162393 RepID=UPI000B28A24B|nr:carbohydrate ABC transporter permease [Microbacterium chocolatum]
MASRVVRRRTQNAFLYAAMALSFAVFVFPLLWVLSTSLKTVPELFAAPPILVPSDPQWGNFLHVIETTGVLVYMRNSLVIVLGTIVLVALIAVPSAYALSRFAFRGRTVYMRGVLALQLISPIIVAVPLYRLFVALGLINNIAALIFVYAALQIPFAVWFLTGYMNTVPIELDEAALTDGASRLRALRSVICRWPPPASPRCSSSWPSRAGRSSSCPTSSSTTRARIRCRWE